MHSSAFFKLFPPPVFLMMPHAGLDVSDEAVRAVAYSHTGRGWRLGLCEEEALPAGLFDGGDFKDEKGMAERLGDFARRFRLSYVKVSVPEEKSYLFQTDVPDEDMRSVEQNIEFKLEQNVPLSAPDAVFYFDLLPPEGSGAPRKASVSVVPRSYIDKYVGLIRSAGMTPVAFEVAPKAVARALVPDGSAETRLIVHVMDGKFGIYVVSGRVVCFTSTVSRLSDGAAAAGLAREAGRVYSYWLSHGPGRGIAETVLVGREARAFEPACRDIAGGAPLSVRVAEVWKNVFDLERYVPPVMADESLRFAVAAGLAMDATFPYPS
ncbi:MAG: pilus assembly protein PilM [Cyanobacteria bacterium REEB65]|nr:pilus assembly protein PilM [Cyanobacteria bacterium REEB65]